VGLPVPADSSPTACSITPGKLVPTRSPVTAGIRLQRERHPVGMMHVKRV
jgi:hypothetical protein